MVDSRDGTNGPGAYNLLMATAAQHPTHTGDVRDASSKEGAG
jgi:hypothetical protein